MGTAVAARAGGDLSQVAAGTPAASGRITVQPRALEKIARESAAEALGVPRGDISVQVDEGSRGVAVRVLAPLPIPDLDDTAAIQGGQPLLERVALVQHSLQDRIARLIGRDVARVDLTVTGAVVAQKKRVK